MLSAGDVRRGGKCLPRLQNAKRPVEFIAHRGESADAPENTLAAFRSSEQFPVISFDADTLAEAKRCLPEHLAFSGPIDAIAPRR